MESTIMARFDAQLSEFLDTAAVPTGSADALYELGLTYCAGRDVPTDLVTAHKWFNIAAMRGSADARRYRMEISAEMTKIEIAKAQKAAREWLSRN
jgi:uncharacterized protein